MSNPQIPLKPCPDTPNCYLIKEAFGINKDLVFTRLLQAIEQTGAESVSPLHEEFKLSAVYKIPVFGFRDDVTAQVISGNGNESILYIRSASRVGSGDFGVNKRRVKRILRKMILP